jgi:hypothetical protein
VENFTGLDLEILPLFEEKAIYPLKNGKTKKISIK